MKESAIDRGDKLIKAYMEAIYGVYGDTVDMAEVTASLSALLKQCVRFMTRHTGNYKYVMESICGILMQETDTLPDNILS